MKISTLALGALISFSIHVVAQDPKPGKVQKNKTKTKCVKQKEQVAVSDSTLLVEPRKHRICEACGRG